MTKAITPHLPSPHTCHHKRGNAAVIPFGPKDACSEAQAEKHPKTRQEADLFPCGSWTGKLRKRLVER